MVQVTGALRAYNQNPFNDHHNQKLISILSKIACAKLCLEEAIKLFT
jgi:hypothetical protein